jgi:hypothetical protein
MLIDLLQFIALPMAGAVIYCVQTIRKIRREQREADAHSMSQPMEK